MESFYSQIYCVAGAILEKDGKVLLVKETKDIAKGQWNLPAGRVDLGEDPIEAVKREVKEETGFDFSPTHFIGIYSCFRKDLQKNFNITPHIIQITFTGTFSEGKKAGIEDDISEIRWFAPEEIESMLKGTIRDLHIKKVIKDCLAGKRYPLDIIHHVVRE